MYQPIRRHHVKGKVHTRAAPAADAAATPIQLMVTSNGVAKLGRGGRRVSLGEFRRGGESVPEERLERDGRNNLFLVALWGWRGRLLLAWMFLIDRVLVVVGRLGQGRGALGLVGLAAQFESHG